MKKNLFGTDGIRGRANEYPMTAEMILRLGMAISLEIKNTTSERSKVIIGKDTRISGYVFESALIAGFTSMGVDVILVGPMPTAAVAILTKNLNANMGVMLSASHNPYFDNGIKIFDSYGFKLSTKTEKSIEANLEQNLSFHLASPENLGRAYRLEDAPRRYIEFAKSTFPQNLKLSGIKVAIDCANGAAYHLGKEIFEELGADVVVLNDNPDGFNINEDCGSSYTEGIIKTVKEQNADIGFALDGDADRVIVCDEKGILADGDQIIAAIVKHWQNYQRITGGCVVVTMMSSLSLESYIANLGLNLYRCPVGDRYVMETMKKYNCNIGGEKSGHIVLSDYTTTGDGFTTALQILSIMVIENKKASEVCQSFIPMPQICRNIVCQDGFDINYQPIKKIIKSAREKIGSNGRLIVRESGTEKLIRLMIEGTDLDLITKVVNELNDSLSMVSKHCSNVRDSVS